MTPPLLLDQIKFLGWNSHRAALWWLAVLYRRPKFLEQSLARKPRGIAMRQGITLYFHFLPYLVVVSILLRASSLLLNHTPRTWLGLFSDVVTVVAVAIVFGIFFGVVFGVGAGFFIGNGGGIAVVIALGIASVVAISVEGRNSDGSAVEIALGIAFGAAGGTAGGIALGVTLGIAFRSVVVIAGVIDTGVATGIAFGFFIGIAGGIAEGIAFGIALGTAIGIAFGIGYLRAFYFLVHPLLIWPRARGSKYPYHPVAWDDLCPVPFRGLDRLLVAFTELRPLGGAAEVERIISSYPSQRTEALRARMILLARESKQLSTLVGLEEVARRLPQGKTTLLFQSGQIAEDLRQISSSQIRLNTISRPILRAPHAQLLVKEIESFRYRIAGFKEPLASEFRAAAIEWGKIAQGQLDEARSILGREPIRQVFRAGDPVKREQEAFVYRDAVAGRLDQQVTLAAGCPGIVLYARRRMGKTTFLTNLDGFLPPSVAIRTFSMQDAALFASMQHFVEGITRGQANDLAGLASYFSREDQRLRNEGKRLLLTIDEYEGIDKKIGDGVFPKDLLAVVRESIQQHRQIIWLFAGSHEITELRHAEWPSYLISARTIEIPFFSLDETRLLLTDPLKYAPIFQEAGDRPRFAPDLWGVNGIERIHEEAGGWPHLVQLIAETVVDSLNLRGQQFASQDLMETALNEAAISGQLVLFQLMHGESRLPGEWEYLSGFRQAEEQDPPEDEAVRRSLLRRKLIDESGGSWRLRVPLMARWLRLRG